jgi:hypothetical protein
MNGRVSKFLREQATIKNYKTGKVSLDKKVLKILKKNWYSLPWNKRKLWKIKVNESS